MKSIKHSAYSSVDFNVYKKHDQLLNVNYKGNIKITTSNRWRMDDRMFVPVNLQCEEILDYDMKEYLV